MTSNQIDLDQTYKNKTVLVTGAAGFIGSHLVDRLVNIGANVRALDDMSSGDESNLSESMESITYSRSSILDDSLRELVAGTDHIFHLAANASVPRSSDDPNFDFQTNVVGTHRIIMALMEESAGSIVFASSAAVYGEPVSTDMDEDHQTLPQSPYGGSKLAGENLVSSYSRCFGFDHRRVRIFNTYGPRQRKYVMFDLLEKLRKDSSQLEVLGTGEQMRSYSYIDDTVTALLLVGAHPEARGNVYNIGGEQQTRINTIVDLIVNSMDSNPPKVTYTGESWKGDVMKLVADCRRLKGLGFSPSVNLENGIQNLIDWHRENY